MKKRSEIINTLVALSSHRSVKMTNKYTVNLKANPQVKLAPQAVKCLEVVFNIGKVKLTEVELHEAISQSAIQTKQTPWKVFKYYEKAICGTGFLTKC